MAGTFGLAGKHADIKVKGHICTYTQNAPNNEYLVRKIVCDYKQDAPNNEKIW